MKKITFWFSFLFSWLVFFNANAQIEDFENTQVGQVPTGWVKYQSASDDAGFSVSDQAGIASSGTHFLAHFGDDIAAESTSWVVSNGFTVGNSYELSFNWRGKWSFAYNFSAAYISVGSNDPVANPNDFVMLGEYSPSNYSTWLEWNEEMYDLSQYQGQTVYVAFKYVGDHAHDFFIDDVSVAPMPYCDLPSSLSVVRNPNDFHSLDVSWTGVVGQNTYEVAWGAPGFNPDASGVSTQIVTGNTYTITGLQESTTYDVYVRTHCSSYNYSPWEGPETKTTAGPPPANNDCSNAINIDVYAVGASVGNETSGDTTNATDSGNHPTCDDFGTNLDLWYTFTMPAGETKVKVLTGGAEGSSLEAALYDACGGTELDCKSPVSNKTFAGLTPGTTYTLQVWLDDFNSGSFTIALELLPPGPANDDCAGAIALTLGSGSCSNPEIADNTSATDSGVPSPSCGFYQGGDLWYSITVSSTGAFTVETSSAGSAITDTGMALYSGSCGSLNLIECNDDGGASLFSQISAHGLNPGDVYYVRVWEYGNNSYGQFNVCAWEDPYVAVPPNNDCANAINLDVYSAGGGAGNETSGDTTAATDSGNHPSCDNTGTNLDLWYTFTVPAGETGVRVLTGGTQGGRIEAALYDACGGTELDCQGQGNSKIFGGLTAGTTYTLQVWHDDTNAGPFDIVIESLPATPPNNDCANAINLTVYPFGGGAGNETPGDTTAATDSGNQPSCDTTGTNLDLWYTFTATDSSVNVKTGGLKGNRIEAALYDSCGGTELDCFGTGSSKIFSGLTIGTTYVLQVWHDDFNSGPFDIVIELPPPPPANDTCATAEVLNVQPHSCNTTTIGYNNGATDSGEVSPSCANYSGGDLWYSITVPASGAVTVETSDAGGFTDSGMAIYSGTCGSLTEISCNDDGGAGLFSMIELTGQTAGDILYVRVWEYGNNSFGDFGICAYDPTQSSIADNEIAGLKYYPNPTNNILNVEVENSIDNIEIYGLSGNKLLSVQPNTNHAKVDLNNLSQGVYFIKLYADNQVTAFKIVKK